MKNPAANEKGFTIIEVLVSAAVFMVGFSVLIALLNGSLSKFSSQEQVEALALAETDLLTAISRQDTSDVDFVISSSGRSYHIVRTVVRDSAVFVVNVDVFRAKTSKRIVELCNAFAPEE